MLVAFVLLVYLYDADATSTHISVLCVRLFDTIIKFENK